MISIQPSASALIGSLRGLGYSPETALADLVDNSITAGAANVYIDIQWNDGMPIAAIFDDGAGMDQERLADALKLGGDGPEGSRADGDLGRFGMGLKTASLSQSRSFSIVTKAHQAINAASLDVSVIEEHGWIAIIPPTLPIHPFVDELQAGPSGTLVIWDNLDELSGLTGLTKEAFYLRLEDIRAHLGMVFHRFIGGDAQRLTIVLNGRQVRAWDPFQTSHSATKEMPLERIPHSGSSFVVKPYVLPHRDRFANETEFDAAGGPGGWGARQGFYVYRGKRLLVAGSWLGLGGAKTWTRDESSRLARVKVDLPTGLDRDWRIDVRKSQARPPGALRARLTAIAGRCREEAREVFAFRGQGPRLRGATNPAQSIWLSTKSPTGTRYRINRDHPAIIACGQTTTGAKLLNAALSIIERSVPVERIWLDVSESEGAVVHRLDSDEIAQLADQLADLGRTLPVTMTAEQRTEALLLNLPGDLVELRKELTKRLGEHP